MEALASLTPPQRAVLEVLAEAQGRPVSRDELARRAGLKGVDPRRAEAHLVVLRRVLGAETIKNVRRRGWVLVPDAT